MDVASTARSSTSTIDRGSRREKQPRAARVRRLAPNQRTCTGLSTSVTVARDGLEERRRSREGTMTQGRRWSIRGALMLVAAVGVAGCGGDTRHASASSSSAAAAAEPTGGPLKLMVVYEGTGPSSVPEVREG